MDSGQDTPLSGVVPPNQPRMTLLGNVLDPNAPSQGSCTSRTSAPQAWALTYDVFGEPLKSDTTILLVEDGMGAKVASSLCQVARLPVDMEKWGRSTDQEVI